MALLSLLRLEFICFYFPFYSICLILFEIYLISLFLSSSYSLSLLTFIYSSWFIFINCWLCLVIFRSSFYILSISNYFSIWTLFFKSLLFLSLINRRCLAGVDYLLICELFVVEVCSILLMILAVLILLDNTSWQMFLT